MSLTLEQWRKVRNLSQKQLGTRVGVSANTIRAWERNPDQIKIGQVGKLEIALGVSRNDIIFLPCDSKKMELD